MFRLVAVLLSVSLCLVWATSEDRIVNGKISKIMDFPYQVSLLKKLKHFCGGSILTPQWVLTAAHCVVPALKANAIGDLMCRAGSSTWRAGGVLKAVDQAFAHEKYNPVTMDYDVGVLKLQGQFIFSATIKPVELLNSPVPSGSLVVASGWGLQNELDDNIPANLNSVVLSFLPENECSAVHTYEVTERMVCAVGPGQDSCRGDSGGPLNLDDTNTQVGIVSWGVRCALENEPGVYTNLLNPEIRAFIARHAHV